MSLADVFLRNKLYFGSEFERLRSSCVAIMGVGALGCVVAEILVRSGIGRIVLVDRGIVDAPDLGRQSLYSISDIGKHKAEVARKKLLEMTETAEIEGYIRDVNAGGLGELVKDADVWVDCLDNYRSRFALEEQMPDGAILVHGGVERDFGQIVSLKKGETPTLKELYSTLNDSSGKPLPVSTSAAFLVASIMAEETIKCTLGKPALMGKMLVVELSDFRFNFIRLS